MNPNFTDYNYNGFQYYQTNPPTNTYVNYNSYNEQKRK